MDLDNIPQQSKKLIDKMAGAVETTSKQVAEKVSNITEKKTEELTEEVIQTAAYLLKKAGKTVALSDNI